MLIELKNNIKYKFPKSYDLIRSSVFSFYIKVRSRKLDAFKNGKMDRVTKDINFNNVKYKLVLDKSNGFVDEEIYWKGVYEEEVMEALQKSIEKAYKHFNKHSNSSNKKEKKILFLDIGANIGQELIFAAALARDYNIAGFSAVGFEPIQRLCGQVNQSIKANNFNVHIMNYALGQVEQELNIKTPVINVGGSSLVRNETNTVGEIIEEKIFVKNGDDVVANILYESKKENSIILDQNNIKLIIKIDVEGYEYEVIKGLDDTIKKYKPKIILEYSPAFYIKDSAMGDRSQIGIELLKIFKEENYIMEIIDIGEYKNKIYKGEDIIDWGHKFKGEQANLLLY